MGIEAVKEKASERSFFVSRPAWRASPSRPIYNKIIAVICDYFIVYGRGSKGASRMRLKEHSVCSALDPSRSEEESRMGFGSEWTLLGLLF